MKLKYRITSIDFIFILFNFFLFLVSYKFNPYLLIIPYLLFLFKSFYNNEFVVYSIAFLVPFSVVNKLPIVSFSLNTIYIILIIFLNLLNKKIQISKNNLFLFPFILVILIQNLFNGAFSLVLAFNFLLFFFIISIIRKHIYNFFILKNILIYSALGFLLSSITGIFIEKFDLIYYLVIQNNFNNHELSSRFFGLWNDPNIQGVLAIFNLSFVLLHIKYSKSNILPQIFIFLLISLFGFLTLSKTFFILFILLVFTYFISILSNKNFIFLPFILLLSLIGFSILTNSQIFNQLIERFNFTNDNQNIDNIFTNRVSIWSSYFSFANLNLFFGYGFKNPILSGLLAPHNTILQVSYFIGIIPFLIFLQSFNIKIPIKLINIKIIFMFIPFISILLVDVILFDFFWLFFSIFLSSLIFINQTIYE